MRAKGLAAPSLPNQEAAVGQTAGQTAAKAEAHRGRIRSLEPLLRDRGSSVPGEGRGWVCSTVRTHGWLQGEGNLGKRAAETMESATRWKESGGIRIMDSKRQTSINSGSWWMGSPGKIV